jgi:tRNA1Val (adenine37-N6)-methyltransferase
MPNTYFQFKKFTIFQDKCAMKVTTDACLFGAWAAEKALNTGSVARSMLDIGTGTGLLSLMMAQKTAGQIDAIEIDKDSYEQANSNIAASPWQERINIYHADAKQYSFSHKYNVIISNPPFYENELKSGDTKKNIAHHNEGLVLQELCSIMKTQLMANGSFYLLLPYKRNQEIRKWFTETGLHILEMVFVKQTPKHSYFRIMIRGCLRTENQKETAIDEISITDETGLYTPAFTSLLKDYYLNL